MALTSTKLNISWSLDSTPKEFVFTDVTDYAAQSVSLAAVTGSIKVTAPSGVTYTGQPDDVDGSVGRINKNQILVPLLSDGTPEIGNYTFTYTATDGVDTVVYNKIVNFQYVKPTAGINSVFDCLSPNLYTEDVTNYLYGAINPVDRFSITAADAGANTFTIAGEKSAFVRSGDTFTVAGVPDPDAAVNGEYTVSSVDFDGTNTIISVASVPNTTSDSGFLITRKTQIFYPQVLGINPVVGYSKKLETPVFYTNTHEFSYETKSFYDLGDGVSIVDSNSDTQELDIQCDVRLCEIFCCINSKFNEYITYKNRNNKTLADYALEQYVLATSHLAALRTAFECGKSQAVTDLTNQIKEITQCNGDCSCEDGSPVLVTGLGGGTNTVVQSSGNGIVVSSITAGDTTTYTLSLAQSIIDDINSITPNTTTSISSSDGTVSFTPNVVGSNTDYDLSVPAAIKPKETISFRAEFENDFAGTRTFTASHVIIQGSTATPNFVSPNLSIVSTGAEPSYHVFRVRINNFQSAGNNTYKAFVTPYFTEVVSSGVTTDSTLPNGVFQQYVTPVIIEQKSNEFDLIFNISAYDDTLKTGSVFLAPGGISKIYFNVQIFE